MGRLRVDGSEAWFAAYVEELASVIGHADRVAPLPSRVLPRTSDQLSWLMKCNSDRCWAETRIGAVTAAIRSTLLRSQASSKPELLLSHRGPRRAFVRETARDCFPVEQGKVTNVRSAVGLLWQIDNWVIRMLCDKREIARALGLYPARLFLAHAGS